MNINKKAIYNISKFEDTITYTFENKSYILEALTHSSYSNENKNYKFTYTVNVLNTITNETFTKNFEAQVSTLSYELPSIIKFVESRVTNDKITIEYKYQDEDNLITIFRGMVKLLKYAGYIVTKRDWDDIGHKLEKDKDFDNLSLDNSLLSDEEE